MTILRKPFVAWIVAFYATWLVLVMSGQLWPVIREHWGIAAAMAAGSYFAGSTPLGGGTVGFPILVLLFDAPATLGRDFSFCIQSIGMVSATIFILGRRQPLEMEMLRFAVLGSLIGTPLGILYLAPWVSELVIKVLFAVVWASFGVLHLLHLDEFASYEGVTPGARRLDRVSGLLVGFVGGGTVAAITGVGVDMMIYAVLVLLSRADLKIAIPTSVVLMACTSVIGVVTKAATHGFQPGTYGYWLAAAPVVAIGAPFGALIVDRIGRRITLYVVSVLCIAQFVWTIAKEADQLGALGVVLAIFAACGFLAAFKWLHSIGVRLKRREVRFVGRTPDSSGRSG